MPKQQLMKWVLPEVVDPPDTLCFQINVPNDRQHIAAFYGAIYLLSKPYAWGDDAAHTAIDVGRVWRRIFDQLIAGECNLPTPTPPGGVFEDFEMPLRVDCDCNVFITCCDGTEKKILTADQVRELLTSQPGVGTPQPQPGLCQTYHGLTGAAAPWYVPTTVSTGDTLELVFSSGAWNDGGEVAWRLSNGDQFFDGRNVGHPVLNGSDPLPTEPHMAMLLNIDGSYYNVAAGPVTVPSGVSNAQVLVVPNDDVLTNNAGTITFDLKVCNNQAATYSIDQTLDTFPYDWTTDIAGVSGTQSVWNAGEGWVDVPCDNLLGGSGRYNIVWVHWVFAAPVNIQHFDMRYDAVVGDLADSGTNLVGIVQSGVTTNIFDETPTTGDGQVKSIDGNWDNVSEIKILLFGSDHSDGTCPPTGSVKLHEIHLRGSGAAPS